MLTHAQIWSAIDGLAKRSGLSPSGLAKRAGLDPTTFNKSKRITPDGRERWPSTESVAKSLKATGATLDQFVALISESAHPPAEAVPLIGFAEAGVGGYFDDGLGGGSQQAFCPFYPALNDELMRRHIHGPLELSSEIHRAQAACSRKIVEVQAPAQVGVDKFDYSPQLLF